MGKWHIIRQWKVPGCGQVACHAYLLIFGCYQWLKLLVLKVNMHLMVTAITNCNLRGTFYVSIYQMSIELL